MWLDQLPILGDLPPEIRDPIVRILILIVVLALVWISRRLLTWIVVAPLRRLTNKTPTPTDDNILNAMIMPVRVVIIAIALILSTSILLTSDQSFTQFLQTLARSLIIFAGMVATYRLVDLLFPTSRQLLSLTGINLEERLIPYMRVAIKVTIIAIGAVMILQEFGFDVSGLIAGLGLGSLGLTLAAQDTVANLFGFVSIVGDRPFDVGDYIVTPDAEGVVEHVGVRSTRIRHLDQGLQIMPNNKLANSPITNWSRLHKRRVDFMLGVSYSTTSEQLRILIERIRALLLEHPKVQEDSVTVLFIKFNDSSLDILVRSYLLIPDWGEFNEEKGYLQMGIMDMVDEMNLSIAFPSTSLYIEDLPNELLGGMPKDVVQDVPDMPTPTPEARNYSSAQQDEQDFMDEVHDETPEEGDD